MSRVGLEGGMAWRLSTLLQLGCLVGGSQGFYLPGVAPKSYQAKEEVPLKVVQLSSTKTQLPYDYYSAPYCPPKKRKQQSENLGEVLTGDVITSSPYKINMKVNKACQVLCSKSLNDKQMKQFRMLINEEYRVHMMLDNLPVAMRNEQYDYTIRGFPVGFYTEGDAKSRKHYLYNHIRIAIKYHDDPVAFEGSRIVGFEVTPYSINHEYTLEEGKKELDEDTELHTCNAFVSAKNDPNTLQSADAAAEVVFTYDVKWEESTTSWANRWDVYLKGNPEDEIHYFSIVNSLMITLFLTGVVAMIMLRTLRRDITTYNEMQSLEEAQEESGWKLVHGDVFRPPQFSPMLLSVFAGTGVQVLAMTMLAISFAFMGFLSPANRGGMLTALLVLFVLMGAFAGYWSACMYKFFNGKEWKRNTLYTAFAFPGTLFCIFWALNIIMWYQGSSTALPLGTFVALLVLWFGVSVPLVFVGSYFGFKAETFTIPVRVNQIARHIPEQSWYTHPAFAIAMGGVLPFGAVCIELFFIMSALWLHQIYYVFGFLTVVCFILIATCAEITIVMCYFQLCNEDYRWWWRSFLSSGSSAVYLFIYAIWYYISKLEIDGVLATGIYFAYMMIIAITFFLVTGCIGFFSCFWFVRKIYSAIKVD